MVGPVGGTAPSQCRPPAGNRFDLCWYENDAWVHPLIVPLKAAHLHPPIHPHTKTYTYLERGFRIVPSRSYTLSSASEYLLTRRRHRRLRQKSSSARASVGGS